MCNGDEKVFAQAHRPGPNVQAAKLFWGKLTSIVVYTQSTRLQKLGTAMTTCVEHAEANLGLFVYTSMDCAVPCE